MLAIFCSVQSSSLHLSGLSDAVGGKAPSPIFQLQFGDGAQHVGVAALFSLLCPVPTSRLTDFSCGTFDMLLHR